MPSQTDSAVTEHPLRPAQHRSLLTRKGRTPNPGEALPAGFKYWAFISYSHRDRAWGEWLQRNIESFRTPAPLAGREGLHGHRVPTRPFPVFRDRTELATTINLGEAIRAAISQSLHLVVVCSPATAESKWVDQEIGFFRTLRQGQRVHAFIVDGEPGSSSQGTECFPPAFRRTRDTSRPDVDGGVEPLAADVRRGRDGKRNALLKVLASVLGVEFDALRQRDHERRVRRVWTLAAAMGLLAGAMTGLAWYANGQRLAAKQSQGKAEDNARIANSARIRAVRSERAATDAAESERRSRLLEQLARRRAETSLANMIATQARQDASRGAQYSARSLLASLHATQLAYTQTTDSTMRDLLYRTGGDVLAGHSDVVTGIAMSADGRWLSSVSLDGTLRLWDLARQPRAGEVLRRDLATVPRDGTWVPSTAISADGEWLAATRADAVVVLRRADPSAAEWLRPGIGPIHSVFFGNKNGAMFAAGDAGRVARWTVDALPGVPKVFGGVASGSFTHAAISPDDRWLAVTGTPGLFVWDLQSDGAEPRRLGCDAEGPDRIRFEPDGAVLASIRMTDMFSGLEVCAWDLNDLDTPPASARIGLEWPMDLEMQGGSILVLGKDGLIRLWPCMLDVDPKTCGEGVPVLILGRDFERKEGCAEERFSECAVWWRLALSSRWLASAGFNGTIQLYSVDSLGREPRILPPEDALVARGVLKRDDEYRYEPFNPAFSSQSTRVVQVPVVMLNGDASVATVIDDEGTIRTWRLSGSDRSPLHEERLGLDAGFPGYVQLGMVQPNNKNMFAVCARSGLLSVWRVSDSRPALVGAHGLGQCTPFSSVALSDSGKRVALARDSGAVEILDPIAGRLVERRAVPAELGRVVALRFAADGDTLIAVFVSDRGGGTVALWPGNRRGSGPNVIARSKNALHGLASSGDGTWLAVAEDGVGLRVWRASEPFAKASLLKEYGGSGAKFEFSRDGRTLALVEDRTFALWEPERGGAPLVLALPEVGWSSGIGFSRDGRYVGVGVEDGGAVIWRTRLEDLVSEACRAAGRDLTGDEWSSFFGDVTRRPVCRSSSAAVRPSPASAPRARR